MEARLESLKKEYEQNIKGSSPNTLITIPPPPASMTTIPSRKPNREVKSRTSKGKAKRLYLDDDELDFE